MRRRDRRSKSTKSPRLVKAAGGQVLRGGAFKPRTGPYSFQGIGVEGLEMMAEAGRKHGLLTITEVMTPEYVDISRNMRTSCRSARGTCRTSTCSASWARREAGAAEARFQRDLRRVAERGRIHPGRRQPECHALRAGHPHFRDLHAEHAGSDGDAGLAAAQPSAGDRRTRAMAPDAGNWSRR